MKQFFLQIIKSSFILGILVLGSVIVSNKFVEHRSEGAIFNSIQDIPVNEVGVVLGTTPKTKTGRRNLYFQYRIDAAIALYRAGKIKHILVSGDNSRKDYNEPRYMFEALVKKGIPAEDITLDFAGFRTLDSVVRAHEVFQQKRFTIISQGFHNERALFIAKSHDIEAIAFNAKTPSFYNDSNLQVREYLAKTKAVIDVYFLAKEPKFLGEKENIKV